MQARALAHVLWIGGPPGGGKTSIASWLASRHDLRVYHADAHTYEHHYRALERGLAQATLWETLAPDQRWLGAPARLAELSLAANAERFHLIVEDLLRLPPTPLVVVEGAPLLPWLVEAFLASPGHAVWLLPAPAFQRDKLSERDRTTWLETSDPEQAVENRIERERLVGAAIERGARERAYFTLSVDGSRNLAAMQAAVAELFEPLITYGPRATTRESRRALRRAENETDLRQILLYLAATPAAGDPESYEYSFCCECGASGCEERVPMIVRAYERLAGAGELLV